MQTVLIADVSATSDMQALVVAGDMPRDDAVRQFATNHDLRGIFLTGNDAQHTGVINKIDLLKWVSMQLNQLQDLDEIEEEPIAEGINVRGIQADRSESVLAAILQDLQSATSKYAAKAPATPAPPSEPTPTPVSRSASEQTQKRQVLKQAQKIVKAEASSEKTTPI